MSAVQHLLHEFPRDETRSQFCIEISEQQIIGDPSYLAEPVKGFRDAGILVAIDDVGYGRSCLESMVMLEPDLVKKVEELLGDSSKGETPAAQPSKVGS